MKLLEVSAAPPRSVFYQPFLKHLEKYPQNALSIIFIPTVLSLKDMVK